jgi:multiple sugar transport system ATP-binding protein
MQRVAIGRALVRSPSLYLMDEPLSSLDAKLRNDLRLELKRIQQDLGATMLYVTHDQIEAMTMATRIGVLDAGVLVQVGTPQQIYENPSSAHVASRLGSPRINLFPRALVPALDGPQRAVTVGARAEHLRLHRHMTSTADSAHRPARVRRIERLSDLHLVHVGLDDSEQELIVSAPASESFEPNDAVRVELTRPLWFDADGRRIHA